MKSDKAAAPKTKISLIVSDDKKPLVTLKPGMKMEVISVSLLDSQLKKSTALAARLCGGTNTCIAVIEL